MKTDHRLVKSTFGLSDMVTKFWDFSAHLWHTDFLWRFGFPAVLDNCRLIGRQPHTRRVTVLGFLGAAHFWHTNVARNSGTRGPYIPKAAFSLNHSHQAPNSSVE